MKTGSAHHLYGNFGEKFLSNGTGIFFGTENRKWIELYLLQNTCKFFTFSEHEARHCKIVKSTYLKGVPFWFGMYQGARGLG